jgi:hypothetical protein
MENTFDISMLSVEENFQLDTLKRALKGLPPLIYMVSWSVRKYLKRDANYRSAKFIIIDSGTEIYVLEEGARAFFEEKKKDIHMQYSMYSDAYAGGVELYVPNIGVTGRAKGYRKTISEFRLIA